jgi:type IV secretion system protein VirB2
MGTIQRIKLKLSFTLFLLLANAATFADDALPWESPLKKILDSLTGPVARILGVIAIVIAGFGIAFGEAGSGIRRLFQVIFGLSIVFSAATLVASLFGVSG